MRVYSRSSKALTGLLDLVGNRLPQRYPLRIGASGSDKPRFEGHIDDVRIYTTVLTAEQAAVVATVESISEIAAMAPGDRTAAQRDKLYLCFLDQYAPQDVQTAWRDVAALERERDALWESFPTVMVMEEMDPRRPTYRLDRGAYDNPAEPVSPGVPAVLPPLPQDGPGPKPGFGVGAMACRPAASANGPCDSQSFFGRCTSGPALSKQSRTLGRRENFPVILLCSIGWRRPLSIRDGM
ncbi:MAG: hypothetical protein Ct9H300mP25_10290 [Acidobacteriota bacterium]|nr:MAG: hypothetical protein Ct9H300mP25_10290 [Acidobacteriota bacterium]